MGLGYWIRPMASRHSRRPPGGMNRAPNSLDTHAEESLPAGIDGEAPGIIHRVVGDARIEASIATAGDDT